MSTRPQNLVKIREWIDADGPEPKGGWEWPSPPEYVESRVEGSLRADILAKLGRPADDSCEVRIVEGVIEGGYSEYTVEHDYDIEVWIHEGSQSQRVFETSSWESDSSLASFLKWVSA